MKRRKFLQNASLTGLGIVTASSLIGCDETTSEEKPSEAATAVEIKGARPLVIATWDVKESTQKAWETMANGGSVLDAIEKGCMVEEANAEGQSVGIGGLPDRDGKVTLDACIMSTAGNYGAVVCMQNIVHPIAVARKVMEDTPHVILAGTGAEQFAISEGFEPTNLLTERSRVAWEKWKKTSEYKPIINIENHDTIGMLAMDKNGDIAGGCTTSGLAFKMAGRVGDSAIIGAGLFIDNQIGGATATGLGEEVLKTVGSFLIVELMRQGKSPQEACEEAIARIIEKSPNFQDFQVGYIAINKAGETGFYGIHKGFSVTRFQNNVNENIKSDFLNKV